VRKPRRIGEPAPIQEVLPSILRGLRGGDALQRVREAWAEIVGAEVAHRTRVAAFANGQVRVEVASAALKHDLVTFRGPDLLRGLQERLPDQGVRAVSYRVAALR